MVDAVDDYINLAVVKEISESSTTGGKNIGQPGTFYGRHHFELLAMVQVVEQQWSLGPGRSPLMLVDLRIDVAADKHQVFPAVVVVIEKLGPPAQEGIRRFGDTHLRRDINKVGVAVI